MTTLDLSSTTSFILSFMTPLSTDNNNDGIDVITPSATNGNNNGVNFIISLATVPFKVLGTLTPVPYSSISAWAGLVTPPRKRRRSDDSSEDAAESEDVVRERQEKPIDRYIHDIYNTYKLLEYSKQKKNPYMGFQTEITPGMRSVTINWLLSVHREHKMRPETFYLAVNIFDRYLLQKVVLRSKLQLLGASAMHVASKYEDVSPTCLQVDDYIYMTDYQYTAQEFGDMVRDIVKKLGWNLAFPTPYIFLVIYIKASDPLGDDELKNLVFFLAELAVMHYHIIMKHSPAMIAASAVYAARHILKKTPIWTAGLEQDTNYSEEQLRECAKVFAGFHAAENTELPIAYQKYSELQLGSDKKARRSAGLLLC